jgi:L-cysteine desulfidase
MLTIQEHKNKISLLDTPEEIKEYLDNITGYSNVALKEITKYANALIQAIKPLQQKKKTKKELIQEQKRKQLTFLLK